MERVTIKDLAKASGLSICTINKALYGKPWVSESTRERVLQLAKEMGYQPNRLAQALARRTLSLAVVYPNFWRHWFQPLAEGVRQGIASLQDHNITSRFCEVSGSAESNTFTSVISDLAHEPIDGIIVLSGYPITLDANTSRILSNMTTPIILLGGHTTEVPYLTCVRADARRCGAMAGEMMGLITNGQPAVIIIGQEKVVDHKEKVEGFIAASQSPLLGVYECPDDDPDIALELTARILTEHPDTRGIYVAIDNPCSGVCSYLLNHHLTDSMKVITTGVFPAIHAYMERGAIHASLFQNMIEQGNVAVHVLFDYLTDGSQPESEILVPPYLALKSNIDVWHASSFVTAQ